MVLRKPSWDDARSAVHAAARPLPTVEIPLSDVDGLVLAAPLRTLTAIPPFDTSSVDGFAVRGEGPWRIVGTVLAGQVPTELEIGTAVEIATGAMVPAGTLHVLRTENASVHDGLVEAPVPSKRDWRDTGEEAQAGEELVPAGTRITPGLIGFAASCGYDTLPVHRRPRAALTIFGDELLTAGLPSQGRIRDSLGPSVPAWLRRFGVQVEPPTLVEDTLDAHVSAIAKAAEHADVVITTGGTMHGPVDHLHPALAELGGEYLIDTVAVRPGFPMLVASLPGDRWLVGLPGNPQSAVIALLTLLQPLLAGLTGVTLSRLRRVQLAANVPGRGTDTHLALAHVVNGLATPLAHAGSAMLRGVAQADGFIVVRPGDVAVTGAEMDLIPLPVRSEELR